MAPINNHRHLNAFSDSENDNENKHAKSLNADGGDSPAWSQKRQKYIPPPISALKTKQKKQFPYAELHCHSNFSFLDGASHPEELAEEAVRLSLEALAITDHNGLYGVVRFAEAANALGLPSVFGCELTLPEGQIIVIAKNPAGYMQLAKTISQGQMRGTKGNPKYSLDDLPDDHSDWLVLTACYEGIVPKALRENGKQKAEEILEILTDKFGKENVAVEIWDHNDPIDFERNFQLSNIARKLRVEVVATNNVHYAKPSQRHIANVMSALKLKKNLDEIHHRLLVGGAAHLRSGNEQMSRFKDFKGVVELAADFGKSFSFNLKIIAPKLPNFTVPEGHTEMSWLRELTNRGALKKYGTAKDSPKAYEQINYELEIIDTLGFAGYFLIVWDIVEFCSQENIYCQGRGSAANSAVCYSLGITNADAVTLGLLFERFLSPERDGPPDIDVDIESTRREEVIQYVYAKYGRDRAAQVANVITYKSKMAIRDVGRVLGYEQDVLNMWSKNIDGYHFAPNVLDGIIPKEVLELASQISEFPRHLGIHSGGMVLCELPVSEICPIEWARKENRSVLQWDKEDCASAGLVKFDLLGLGMLEVLHRAVDIVSEHHKVDIDLSKIPQEDDVYKMLQQADSVGVFQVESRAQMATLPRLKPRNFYDLVVEVALIRPGPIQGGSVHPYIRRRNGLEPVTYLHPLLEKSLKKTLGVPLFQEQLMQMAIDIAGFSASEADQLRQAMGSKRSTRRMEMLKQRLYEGMAEKGITGSVADEIFEKLSAFANFGFPESHSVSFAYIVYSSAYLKFHYPAAFLAALLNSQPMGFWSPATLIADAKRHGVKVKAADVNNSHVCAHLHGRDHVVQLGLNQIRGLGKKTAEEIVEKQPFMDIFDFVRKVSVNEKKLESLALAGAFSCFEIDRRDGLWIAGLLEQAGKSHLENISIGLHDKKPTFEKMTAFEEAVADMSSTSVTPNEHLISFLRQSMKCEGIMPSSELKYQKNGSTVKVGGIVTHRQRPATASGITFVNLEDEFGLTNIVCKQVFWNKNRKVLLASPALVFEGILEKVGIVINVVATRVNPLPTGYETHSRDFH